MAIRVSFQFPSEYSILEFGKHLKNRRLHDLVLTERQVCGNGTLALEHWASKKLRDRKKSIMDHKML